MNIPCVCGLSHVSIFDGAAVYLLPIIKREDVSINMSRNPSMFFYPDNIYQFAALPIKGIYDDEEQTLKEIFESENTKAMERIFDTSIREIVDRLTLYKNEEASVKRLKNNYSETIISKMEGMYIHAEMFDNFAKKDNTTVAQINQAIKEADSGMIAVANAEEYVKDIFYSNIFIEPTTVENMSPWTKRMYGHELRNHNSEIVENFSRMHSLYNAMRELNKMFMPTVAGCEGTNGSLEIEMHNLAISILNKERNRYTD